MIAAACFFLLGVLAVRSLVLMAAERKVFLHRVPDLLFAVLFGAAAFGLLLFSGFRLPARIAAQALLFAAFALPAALLLRLRLSTPFRFRSTLFLVKAVFVLLIFCLSLLAVMMSGFRFLTEDEPLLKIRMTGRSRPESIEWKQPESALQRETLRAYEVQIDTPEGEPVDRVYVYGDQVAIKARVIRFRPILNAIGFHNLARIDYLYNGYTTAERFNIYPPRAQKIRAEHPTLERFQDSFWNSWSGLYRQQSTLWWVKSATLESQFFPLVEPDGSPFEGAYFLTVTPGGLSAVPLP